MRARNIKPRFYLNEDLAECSIEARFIFPGLWMLADRMGRLEYRPKRIKAEVVPFDAIDVVPLLDELEKHGLIKYYEVDAKRYIWIPAFLKHQVPHPREKRSEIPKHPEDSNSEELPGKHDRQQKDDDDSYSTQGHALEPHGSVLGHAKTKPRTVSATLNPESGILNPDSQPLVDDGWSRANTEVWQPALGKVSSSLSRDRLDADSGPSSPIFNQPKPFQPDPAPTSKPIKLKATSAIHLSADFTWIGITKSDLNRWEAAFPACDVRVELLRAAEYIRANPNKRKNNWLRYISNWLARQQNYGGTARCRDSPANRGKTEASVDDIYLNYKTP